MSAQADMFEAEGTTLPPGLRYRPDLITADEEAALAARVGALPLKPFEFHGFLGKRRVMWFGWRYINRIIE
jgi:hypothetical protein